MAVMAIMLPYESLLISHSMAATIQLLLIAAIVAYFGRLFLRNLTGSLGTITGDVVVVQPAQLFGLRLAGPAGRFPSANSRQCGWSAFPTRLEFPLRLKLNHMNESTSSGSTVPLT